MGAKRTLKPWTPDEDALVRKGEVPPGRTYNQAATYAYRKGIPWKKLRHESVTAKRWWSKPDKEALRKGLLPEGRTLDACRQAKRLFNIDGPIKEPTKEEVIRALNGESSPWPLAPLRRLARKYGLALSPAVARNSCVADLAKGTIYTRKVFLMSPMTRAEHAWLLYKSGKSLADIGKLLGVSKTRICADVARFEKKIASIA